MKKRKDLIGEVREYIGDDYGIIIEEETLPDGCCQFSFKRDNEVFYLTMFIRNISSAYLKYDPSVDRIQIPPLVSIKKTTRNSASLLIGIKEGALVAWNPFRYTHHSRYRSAYVFQENISRGLQRGFYSNMDHNNQIYVCTRGHFHDVIDAYISDTYVEDSKW